MNGHAFSCLLMILVFSLSVTGCASMMTNDSSRAFVKGQSSNGVAVGVLRSDYPVALDIVIESVDTGKFFTIAMEKDIGNGQSKEFSKAFCVMLPQGEYRLHSLEVNSDFYDSNPINLSGNFKVSAGEVVNVGEVSVQSQEIFASGSTKRLDLHVNVAGQSESVSDGVNKQCPWLG